MSSPPLFPMFVKLEGRSCLVVGGGAIGESKARSLLVAGAHVLVVAPHITAGLEELARSGTIAWRSRNFARSDLDDVLLVIAATSDNEVNELIYREAGRRNVLCNAFDQPDRCHFYFPSIVRRGALQIAISTRGLSPSLAKRLREFRRHAGRGVKPGDCAIHSRSAMRFFSACSLTRASAARTIA